MKALGQTEKEAICAEIRAALPKIEKAAANMGTAIAPLSDVAQKHAITLFVAEWIKDCMEDDAMALSFSKHLHHEIDKVILGSVFPPAEESRH